MPKVGDRVVVTIAGPAALSGTANLGAGNITISGIIVGDEVGRWGEPDHWIVKLDATFDGRNLLRVLKSSLVQERSA
jgi:hypothetical protein